MTGYLLAMRRRKAAGLFIFGPFVWRGRGLSPIVSNVAASALLRRVAVCFLSSREV